MKLRAFREEPLPALIAEAGWRAIRSARKSVLRFAESGGVCPARFHPLGYYRVKKSLLSPRSREAIPAYADAILRGEYPLIGYGNPLLATTPDLHTDCCSGKSRPLDHSQRIRLLPYVD